ncbi:hypothetical protein [Flavobacterium sp. J27]|uniref:hypothetical protein n=1 Tax=Flavobacterium sp. J27 TaxID=2060419 RepID=UPI0010310EFF|nr:hypothetical protein [Flavobacterium sp. J27]
MRTETRFENLQFRENLKRSLATKLNLTELYSGKQTIRNEKGWRDNEISIDYIWIVNISRSFVGWGGLVTIKFEESHFRKINNPEKLVQGIFLYDGKGEITAFYFEEQTKEFNDPIFNIQNLELFTANKGITLDGVFYEYEIIATNIHTCITVNNPNNNNWKFWENEIWKLGNRLSQESKNNEMMVLFK